MNRIALFVLLIAGMSLPAFAQNVVPGGGGATVGGGQSGTIFDELNKDYDKNKFKLNGRDKEGVKRTLEGTNPADGPKGNVPKHRAAICAICQEMMYRHSEDGFRCIPKDKDGAPISVAEIQWKKLHCPICQSQFLGALPGNVNNKNGVDRDMCNHSVGKACVHSNVWTCPDCGYAALVDSFGSSWDGKPVDADTAAFVRQSVSPLMFIRMCKLAGIKEDFIEKGDKLNLKHFGAYINQEDFQQEQIPDWIKYDNAIKIYKHQKAPSTLMARLYLEAAHACRRELNGEISVPGLQSQTEEALSYSLRRIQHDITAASMEIRRNRKQVSMIDPNRADIDPEVLCEAVVMLIKLGEGDGLRLHTVQRNLQNDNPDVYSRADMYVLYLRTAGFMDRMGRMEEADKALQRALKFVMPETSADARGRNEAELAFGNKQLKLLNDVAEERRTILTFEKECLNRAMWENLLAIHRDRVRFFSPESLLTPPEKGQLNPAETAFMLGELARRCGEPVAAPAFLTAADTIIRQQFAQLDKEELRIETVKTANPAIYDKGKKYAKELNKSWSLLQLWVSDQSKLAAVQLKPRRTNEALDKDMKVVLDKILTAAGIDPTTFKVSDLPMPAQTKPVEAPPTTVAPATPVAVAPPVNTGNIKTREALYKMYYKAIADYVSDKKSNPPTLAALVDGNYILSDNSCLNEKGKLVCPETNEPLQYSKMFKLGDVNDFVLYQLKNATTSRILYADGTVRTPVMRK